MSYDEVEKLVAHGPEKGDYTLIDSRPLPRVQEGTIPTAINLPYPAFDKFVDRLPKDKSRLTIFFCQGVTCMMSPNSLRKAEAHGLHQRQGLPRRLCPSGSRRTSACIAAPSLKEAWIDKDIPHVLIDVRPARRPRDGLHPRRGVDAAVADRARRSRRLPAAKLKAPIMVYDGDGGNAAHAGRAA